MSYRSGTILALELFERFYSARKEIGMIFLDFDGRLHMGRPAFAVSPSQQSVNDAVDAVDTTDIPATVALLPARSWQHLFPPGSWHYRVARLLQRVQETRELLHEDLQEIAEPLRMLATGDAGEEADGVPLSPERQAQWHAAEMDYQQAREVIDQALARILRHFPTEGAILHQARCERLPEIASPSPTASSLLPEAPCVAPIRS